MRILPGGRAPGLPWSCAAVVAGQEGGQDPTAPWRAALRDLTRAQYGESPPAAMPAAFVLQWYLQVVAYPAAFAATLTTGVLDVSPQRLTFDLAPGALYPDRVALAPGGDDLGDLAAPGADPDDPAARADRQEIAHRRYTEHATRFVLSYQPGVKMGSRQRLGALHDMWDQALTAAHLTLRLSPAAGAPRRESCCFIYTLPGADECASCPRLGPAPTTGEG